MRQRIITGTLFTFAVAAFIIPGYWVAWPPIILFVIVALLTSQELTLALRRRGLRPNGFMASAGSLVMLLPLLGAALFRNGRDGKVAGLIGQVAGGLSLMAFGLLTVMLFTVTAIVLKRGAKGLPDAVATAAIIGYVAFPLGCPVLLSIEISGGYVWLLVGLVSPWISDCFAYFTGSLIGKRPIVPAISPKKTVEGFWGGMVGCMLVIPLVFVLFGHRLGPITGWWPVVIFAMASGLLLSLVSQLGDWLASGIKRWCRVKDFGSILPGHGGILDRFDSAFFTLPVSLILAVLFQLLVTG
ncbi:MAG: phosphatidate cytidylyltransferase [Saccharofermentanales bacterium]|jgi:phosphatidate cytidylyltransferase|nr:phosphatidate cytidylyltransferase [Clostridiaceae bacterium]